MKIIYNHEGRLPINRDKEYEPLIYNNIAIIFSYEKVKKSRRKIQLSPFLII
jgi:hypothetical protein